MKGEQTNRRLAMIGAAFLGGTLGMGMSAHASDPGAAHLVVLPSGAEVSLLEIIWDEDEEIGRFRFVAPALVAGIEDEAAIDAAMETLCHDFALPVQRGLRPGWDSVVISLAEASIPFGEYEPSVLQLFAGFTISGAACRWEEF